MGGSTKRYQFGAMEDTVRRKPAPAKSRKMGTRRSQADFQFPNDTPDLIVFTEQQHCESHMRVFVRVEAWRNFRGVWSTLCRWVVCQTERFLAVLSSHHLRVFEIFFFVYKKLYSICHRYVSISYGTTQPSHAFQFMNCDTVKSSQHEARLIRMIFGKVKHLVHRSEIRQNQTANSFTNS